ncbi:hypothetical protein HYALB_00012089 [Hymenoscyphus albidus]|uniref:Uncharacterized protein n=1 Tax=Hymenoscyphus albidus TaxID=595503 RepID=A0A9N9LLY1_9HELO|nr:hypothetical protein HYALB_00012089 [Hymenoscyphus albidus]
MLFGIETSDQVNDMLLSAPFTQYLAQQFASQFVARIRKRRADLLLPPPPQIRDLGVNPSRAKPSHSRDPNLNYIVTEKMTSPLDHPAFNHIPPWVQAKLSPIAITKIKDVYQFVEEECIPAEPLMKQQNASPETR